jgi:hypothetical protein
MTNEEFQRLVLQKLDNLELGQKSLEEGQNRLEKRQKSLELGQRNLEQRQKNLELGQKNLEERQKNLELETKEISKKLDAVVEQTADLTEFRHEVKSELKYIGTTMSRIEIATADNWSDIAKLKSAR